MPDPVLLLHGQPGSAGDWNRVRAAIGSRAETIAIDRPGWNGVQPPSDLAGNARAALDAIDGAGAERAIVVGHSFGGAVAASLARHRPERVRALVLAAPSANRESLLLGRPAARVARGRARGKRRRARVLGIALADAAAAGPGRSRPGARGALPAVHRPDPGDATRMAVVLSGAAPAVARPAALEARLEQIRAPATIVIGTADRIVPVSSARRLAEQLPDAQLVELERANHLLPQQRAEQLAGIILEASRPLNGYCQSPRPDSGSGTAGVTGSSGAGTVAGSSGSAGVPGSGTAGDHGRLGHRGSHRIAGCGTTIPPLYPQSSVSAIRGLVRDTSGVESAHRRAGHPLLRQRERSLGAGRRGARVGDGVPRRHRRQRRAAGDRARSARLARARCSGS